MNVGMVVTVLPKFCFSSAKYQRPSPIPNPTALSTVAAFEKLVETHLLPNAERDDAQGFRRW
jgi:hypothetical protein